MLSSARWDGGREGVEEEGKDQVYMEVQIFFGAGRTRGMELPRVLGWFFKSGGAVKPFQKTVWLVLHSIQQGATPRQDGTAHFSLHAVRIHSSSKGARV